MPKFDFSIESLVGEHSESPTEDIDRDYDDSLLMDRSLSSASPEPYDKFPAVHKPQPLNGATQRLNPDTLSNLPAFLQMAKGLGTFGNPLISRGICLPPLSSLHNIPQPLPHMGQLPGTLPREYPLYPWLISRHGRVFPQGTPSPEQLLYLLQPFRKQKRVRTAFNPSQLLKLEDAFEKNSYVVGRERKQLAHSLNLSETQVKVWFQNRRTKEKRIHQDDESEDKDKPDKKRIREDDDERTEKDSLEYSKYSIKHQYPIPHE